MFLNYRTNQKFQTLPTYPTYHLRLRCQKNLSYLMFLTLLMYPMYRLRLKCLKCLNFLSYRRCRLRRKYLTYH
jgi:hypothetical protein